jgi:hypothetical protein
VGIDLEKVHKALTDKVIDLPGVAGVGLGSKRGKPCLKVFLEGDAAGLAGRIPSSFMGVDVTTEKTGGFRGGG